MMSPFSITKLTKEEEEKEEEPPPLQHQLYAIPSNAASHDIPLEVKWKKRL